MTAAAATDLNAVVWVELTDVGWETLAQHIGRAKPELQVALWRSFTAGHRWWRFHLWELMQIFGPVLGLAKPTPFVGHVIQFVKPADAS